MKIPGEMPADSRMMPSALDARTRLAKFVPGAAARILWGSGIFYVVRWVLSGMPV